MWSDTFLLLERAHLLRLVTWGAASVVLGTIDLQDAAQLDRFLWLNVGLDAGYVGIGATLAIAAWVLGRRWGGVGAGVAIVIQGLALLVLDARFLFIIDRFV